jgi:hypothetical protein
VSEREQQLMAAVLPQANFEAGRLAVEALMHQLAQKLAANMVLASDLQDARHKVENFLARRAVLDKWLKAMGWDGVQNREDWMAQKFNAMAEDLQTARQDAMGMEAANEAIFERLFEAFGEPEERLPRGNRPQGVKIPDTNTLLARAISANEDRLKRMAFVDAVRHILDFGWLPETPEMPAGLREALEHVDRKVREADSKAAPATVDWGVITRLRSVLGHLRGNRLPSATSLLDAVIDELTSQVEPQVVSPDQEDELAEATAADRKIKENKEDPQPAM